jgi:hypothetical protein
LRPGFQRLLQSRVHCPGRRDQWFAGTGLGIDRRIGSPKRRGP